VSAALALVGLALLAAPAAEGAQAGVIAPDPPRLVEPTPEAIARARGAYEAAAETFYRGRLAEALAHTEAAWLALPNASSALIMATVLAELARPCDAVPMLLLALDLDPVEGERDAVAELLAEQSAACAPGYGWVTLEASAAGAWVELDGSRMALPRTVALSAGAWKTVAGAEGRASARQVIEVTPGRGAHITFALAEQPQAVEPQAVEPQAVEPQAMEPLPAPAVVGEPPSADLHADLAGPDTSLAWALLVSGAAAAVVGAVLYGLAVEEVGVGERIVAGAAEPPSDEDRRALASSRSHARRLEVGGWVAGGLGLAAATTGLIVLLAGGSDDDGAMVHVGLGAGGPSLGLTGRF